MEAHPSLIGPVKRPIKISLLFFSSWQIWISFLGHVFWWSRGVINESSRFGWTSLHNTVQSILCTCYESRLYKLNSVWHFYKIFWIWFVQLLHRVEAYNTSLNKFSPLFYIYLINDSLLFQWKEFENFRLMLNYGLLILLIFIKWW